MIKRIVIWLMITAVSICRISAADNQMQTISDLFGQFGKMSDGLDKLKCRPADGQSIYGFYLGEQASMIPRTFEAGNEYIILVSCSEDVMCRIEHGSEGRVYAEQKGSRIYMKYTAKNMVKANISVASEAVGKPVILIIMCRDRYSIPILFEDLLSAVRDLNDCSDGRGSELTSKIPYFLVGGTFASGTGSELYIPEGQVSSFRFLLGHSKTVGSTGVELHRGSGVSSVVTGSDILCMDAKMTRQARYSIAYINHSPRAFEHGILLLAAFDR